ncbi:Nucleolar protein 6 [Galdieria sulphuraria]|nr:Nucleolar protein 6 [Galdieria sulphuraria]
MMILSDYLSSICSKRIEDDSSSLDGIRSKIELQMKQAISRWKWNSISSTQKQLSSFLRACDGLWSDRYDNHPTRDSRSSNGVGQPWSFTFEEHCWLRVLSVKSAGASRLFVLVEMPRKLFVTSDILHWRYHDKRKIFLAVLGWCLAQSGHFVEIVPWAVGKPLLRFRLDKTFDIFLFPCAPKDVFQPEKIFKKKTLAWNGHSDYYYRTTLLEDVLLEPTFQQVIKAEENFSEWKQVIHFFQNWYSTWHKRNNLFVQSEDIFLMSVWFMIDSIVTKDMHWKRLDHIHLLEYCFQILNCQVKDILQGERQSLLPLVYLCPFMDLIPLSSLPKDCTVYGDLYSLWKSIQYTIRSFDMSTCLKSQWITMGDWMLCTAFPGELHEDSDHSLVGLWDTFLSIEFSVPKEWKMLELISFLAKCYWILYQALWKRCVYLSVVQISIQGSSGCFVVGCRLTPKDAFAMVEKATNQQEKEHFLTFWKEKCELRRYRDGNVCESLVWKQQQEEETDVPLQSLFHRICHYALSRQMPWVKGEQIQIFCDLLESLLPSPSYDQSFSSLPWVAGFERLVNRLRKLEELPFGIHNICVVGDMFRGTSVILPDVWQNQAIFQHVDAPKAMIVVENNIQWPIMDDREAQQMMRIGYYLALKKCLQDQGIESCVDERGLDVVFEDYIYRFEIWMLQEYQQALTNEHRETVVAIQLHYHLKYMTEKDTFQQSFADACRLAKRWLSCHMFSDYFADEMVELLVARAYIHEMGSLDGDIPCTGFSGFYHFLYVLSLFANQKSTIVVPVPDHDELEDVHSVFPFIEDSNQVSNIYIQQQAHSFYWMLHNRFLFPLYRSAQGIPEWPVLKRIGQVAKATCKALEQRIISPDKWNMDGLKIVFRPDVSVYDAVIVMHKKYLSRVERYSLDSCKKKYPSAKSIPLDALYVNLDPLEYFVQQLREKFGTFALFFYDKYGGYQIGLLWRPVKRTFSLSHMPFMKPEKGQWQVNYDEILYDIKQMGGPWIKQIKQDKPH